MLVSCGICGEEPVCLPCLDRAVFTEISDSEYILPFSAGESHVLLQSYCNSSGGHRNQLAYDFAMMVGKQVVASRSGTVMEIRQDVPDKASDSDPGQHNHVFIRHQDGSLAFYAHLQQNSVMAEPGEEVLQGEVIALSGNSGNTGEFPHLHFGVYQAYPAVEGCDVPVVFRNMSGPLDERGGLVADQWYTALPD